MERVRAVATRTMHLPMGKLSAGVEDGLTIVMVILMLMVMKMHMPRKLKLCALLWGNSLQVMKMVLNIVLMTIKI